MSVYLDVLLADRDAGEVIERMRTPEPPVILTQLQMDAMDDMASLGETL